MFRPFVKLLTWHIYVSEVTVDVGEVSRLANKGNFGESLLGDGLSAGGKIYIL
jgi:hypothetical protein